MVPDANTIPEPAPPITPTIDVSAPDHPHASAGQVRDIDVSTGDKETVADVTGMDLLKFAHRILLALLGLSVMVMLMYYFSDRKGTNEVAAKEIFEVIKVGVLPLVSLVIGFYFRKTDK